MYEYKFVRLDVSWGFFAMREPKGYQEIIEQHAQQGWRLVQVLAPPLGVMGTAHYFELIFEKAK
jgi:hypothetical protein